MSRGSLRTWLLAATSGTALAAAGLPDASQAQTQPVPPEHFTLDSRGVDLVSGTFNHETTEVEIGSPEAGGLSYGRFFMVNGWRDTSIGGITGAGADIMVSVGPISEAFVYNGSAWVSKYDNGSTWDTTVLNTIKVTDRHGAIAVFSSLLGADADTNPYGASLGLITSLTTPAGEVTTYTYTTGSWCTVRCRPIHRLSAITNNRGYMLKYTYASDSPANNTTWWRVTNVRGINLAVDYCAATATACTTFTETWPSVTYGGFTSNGWPTTATDQSGRTTTYGYGNGGLATVRYPGTTSDDITVTYNASPDFRVNGVTDPSGAWTYGYSTSGSNQTTSVVGPLGQSLTAGIDMTTGRLTSATDALSHTWAYQYDSNLRVTRITQPEGDYVQYAYGSRSNPTTTTWVAKPGSGLSPLSSSSTFDTTCANPVTCNLPNSTTDTAGNITNYTWDAVHGGPLTITAPAPTAGADRPQTRYTYTAQTAYYKNSSGVIVAAPSSVTLPTQVSACATGTSCIGGANEVRTTIAYGSAGVANNLDPSGVSHGSGANPTMSTTYMTWTPNGDLEYVDGPLSGSGDTTRYRYDSARQLVGVVGPDPDGAGAGSHRAQRLTYSPRGQVTLAETGTTAGYGDADWANFNPLVRSATVYDDRGRTLVVSQQSGAGTTVGVQQVSYDASGRPECTAVRMNPAAWGSLPTSACTPTTAGSSGPDRINRATYDAAGRTLSTTSAYGLTEAVTTGLTYTTNGQVASLTDGNGNVSIQVYDGFDRPVTLRYPNPTGGGTSATDYEQVTYDAYGRAVASRNRAGQTTTLTLDNLGRVTAVDAPAGTTDVAYAYDNLGRQTLSWFSGYVQPISKTWDSLGRQTSENGPLGTMSYQYDAAGRMTRITWPDAFYAQYDHDLYGSVTAIRENGATSGAGVLAQYAYNDLGQRTGIARGNGTATAYGYDAAGRMTGLSHDVAGSGYDVVFGYAYNPAGQISSRTVSNPAYVYAPTTGSTGYANDGLNAVTSVGGGSVTYDANHNITGALGATYAYDAANRLTSTASTSFGYDPAGRLYSHSSAGIRYQYAGHPVVGDINSTGVILKRYVPGPGLDEPVTTHYGSGLSTRMWMLADERGSVISLTDGSASTLNVNRYDEYGAPAPGNSDLFQYTGQTYLAPGLYHYRARVYAPQLGRFLQTDPIGYQAGANLYAYVGADPVNLADPSGLAARAIVCSGAGVVVDAVGTSPLKEKCRQTKGFPTAIAIRFGDRGDPDPSGSSNPQISPPVPQQCRIDGGDRLNLFPNDSAGDNFGRSRNPRSGSFLVGAHGNRSGAYGPDGQPMTPGSLADAIREAPGYRRGQSVTLGSCRVGQGDYAQQLANELGACVTAPEGYAYYSRQGGEVSSNSRGQSLVSGGERRGAPEAWVTRCPNPAP